MHWGCREWGKQRLGRKLQDCTNVLQLARLRGLCFMEDRGALVGSMRYFCPAQW